jgi:mannose-6-phosphate isomerase-like protein (cupin superfamily)
MKKLDKLVLAQKFRSFNTVWDPHVVAELNGQQLKLVKCIGPGDVVLHEEEVLYLVFTGSLKVVFRDHRIELEPGELIVIPRGTSCKLAAVRGAELLILDPVGYKAPANLNNLFYPGKLKKI